MLARRWWSSLVFHTARIRQAVVARRQKRALRKELKRLSSLGDHLIDDVGLDPQAVRRWLKRAE